MIKVCENSNNKIDDYQLKYCYMYIIKSKKEYEINNDNNILKIINNFKIEDNYYLILWNQKEDVKIKFNNYKSPIYITNILIKTEDSYVIAKNKLLKNIKDIMKQQYLDLTYKKYNTYNILSSVWLNILTSNKLLYYKYFISKNIIINTKIKKLQLDKINSYKKNYIIKAPYSSASFCIKKNNKMNIECFIDEGVIISKINKTLENIEIKIHTFRGHIIYSMIKTKFIENLSTDNELKIINYDIYTDKQNIYILNF